MDFAPETKLTSPPAFSFPFEPYSIQTDFMQNLYSTLENKKLGIFESPTGTGKSMSIICGALKWLYDSEERRKNDLIESIAKLNESLLSMKNSTSKDWLNDHEITSKARHSKMLYTQTLKRVKELDQRMLEIKKLANDLQINRNTGSLNKKTKGDGKKSLKLERLKNKTHEDKNIDDESLLLVDEKNLVNETFSSDDETEDEEQYHNPKIIICSRTHSQLSQFVGEIAKSPFNNLSVRVVPLASRQHLCINEQVLGLKQLPLINDACQDLRSKKSCTTKKDNNGEKAKKIKLSGGCPYTNETNMKQLNSKILTEIHDLEDLNTSGHLLSGCPYFATRNAIKDAQIILLPYNILLHKSTREASGLDIKDSVIIVDEAHNLLDTIGQIHSSMVTGLQITHGHSILVQYRDKYTDRFSPTNLLNLNQLIYVLKKLQEKLINDSSSGTVVPLSEFLITTQIDNINLHNLLKFVQNSRLSQKLRGFIGKFQPQVQLQKSNTENKAQGVKAFLKAIQTGKSTNVEEHENVENKDQSLESIGNPTLAVLSFLEALTNHCEDGRVVCKANKLLGCAYLKFLLLNPAAHFHDIVKQARSVVVAGGTMQPISEFTEQLFGMSDRIHIFTCGHIIPPENILPLVVASGPTGRQFVFNYTTRDANELIDELGLLLINVCRIVPAGVVVFFPSYDYEARVHQRLSQTEKLRALEQRKRVLREPRGGHVDHVLIEYAKCATNGALLFAVIGGKLSEGLNFNDHLGRCVVVVGMPYPNRNSPELIEKMAYLDRNAKTGAGQVYYENLCMKAVNQSIGRSVRHAKDYASVLLVDNRYMKPNIQAALPGWIKTSLKEAEDFRTVPKQLASFFTSKK